MKNHAKLNPQVKAFQTQLRIGAGRAAFRRVDKLLRFEIGILGVKADADWENLKCSGVKDLPRLLVDMTYILDVLIAANQPKSNVSIYNKLIELLKPYGKDPVEGSSYHFTLYDAKAEADQDPRDRMDELRKMTIRQSDQEEDREREKGNFGKTPKKRGKPPPPRNAGNNATVETCEGCGKTGHPKAKCWQLHPELMPPRIKAKEERKPSGRAAPVQQQHQQQQHQQQQWQQQRK
jgi:hypothetical protein